MSRVPIQSRLRIDPYIVALLATVAVASLLPARGVVATGFGYATTIAIGFLFCSTEPGCRPSRRSTGLDTGGCIRSCSPAPSCCSRCWAWPRSCWCQAQSTPELYAGLMFLWRCLPSTVQSSIAFTPIARGNVTAAICSASMSNPIGIVLTPLLVTLLSFTGHPRRAVLWAPCGEIMLQLLVPFVA